MQVAIGLFPGFTALDFVGPYQVFVGLPGNEVVLCAETTGRISDEHQVLHLDIEHTFADVAEPDVLLLPGGPVSQVKAAAASAPMIDWVRSTHGRTKYTASVCTGALLLATAGLLDGVTATTHWAAYDELRKLGAEPTEQRVVFHDGIVTGAGVSAGIDLALAVVAELQGTEMAQAVQLGIEYDPQPPFDCGAPSKADPAIRDLVAAAIASH